MEVQNKFGNDEVVDTLSDLIRAEMDFRAAFPDKKFNLMLFLSAGLKQYPHLEEVLTDFDTFSDEIGDLSPEEAIDAYQRIVSSVGADAVNRSRLFRVVRFAGTSYVYIDETVADSKALYEKTKAKGEELLGMIKDIGAKQ